MQGKRHTFTLDRGAESLLRRLSTISEIPGAAVAREGLRITGILREHIDQGFTEFNATNPETGEQRRIVLPFQVLDWKPAPAAEERGPNV